MRQLLHATRVRGTSPNAHVVFPRALPWRREVSPATPSVGRARGVESRSDQLPQECEFFDWLFAQVGLDARLYRSETLDRRLPACLRALHVGSAAQARRVLERSPGLLTIAINAVLIGVTSFFRDTEVFEALGQLLPCMIQRTGRLHVWSMSCSDGAELYSVAMLLAEQQLLARSHLLGTDCRSTVIAEAREGYYPPAAMDCINPERRSQHFTLQGHRWQINASLRQSLHWKTVNLLDAFVPGCWDVILFRNTAMYMRLDALGTLWERIEAALRPGGLLVVGKAERPRGAKHLACIAPCIYQRPGRSA